ncbi:hypothetical protein C8F01DRAFT_1179838 [Mycena amicta]|nr:hypothetical protein C8F01DRAFT_1179838 [Mycena amicta]
MHADGRLPPLAHSPVSLRRLETLLFNSNLAHITSLRPPSAKHSRAWRYLFRYAFPFHACKPHATVVLMGLRAGFDHGLRIVPIGLPYLPRPRSHDIESSTYLVSASSAGCLWWPASSPDPRRMVHASFSLLRASFLSIRFARLSHAYLTDSWEDAAVHLNASLCQCQFRSRRTRSTSNRRSVICVLPVRADFNSVTPRVLNPYVAAGKTEYQRARFVR